MEAVTVARLPASRPLYSCVIDRKDLGVVYTCLQERGVQVSDCDRRARHRVHVMLANACTAIQVCSSARHVLC